MPTALVIGRRRKGRPIQRVVRETARRLEEAGWTVEQAVVKKKKALRQHAAAAVEQATEVVVAVGGDGAVLQVLQGVGETPAVLGIIPMGTGNLLATNLEIPKRLDDAVRVLLEGVRRQVDLGHASVDGTERLFSVACGVGFDAEVMKATSKARKRRWGKLAYVASAIGVSRHVRDVPHTITVDGKETAMPAMQAFVANFGRTGLSFKPRLPVEPADGALDVIVLRAPGRLRAVVAAWQAIQQPHEGHASNGRVFRAKGREIRIDAQPKRLVEIDGSVLGTTPVTVSVRPGALTVLVPAPKS
jgi:YegS/Rv2252/BmrU family lipid kinase